jgi:hypothetical protein
MSELPSATTKQNTKFFTDYDKVTAIIENKENTTKHLSYIRRYIELFYTKWDNLMKVKDSALNARIEWKYNLLVERLTTEY